MSDVTASRIRAALVDIDFPCSKENVVRHAETGGGDVDVLRALRSLPLADYANVEEVVRSVDTVEATGTTTSQKGAHAPDRSHPQVAEHMRAGREDGRGRG